MDSFLDFERLDLDTVFDTQWLAITRCVISLKYYQSCQHLGLLSTLSTFLRGQNNDLRGNINAMHDALTFFEVHRHLSRKVKRR